MVVLINEGTASGAEMVASALKDNKRATLVGVRTYRKASVQTAYPLRDKSSVQFTTDRFYAPSGVTIENRGVEPDIKVERLGTSPNDPDVQLQKAIEVAASP